MPKRVVRQEFAIQCTAQSEFIAAGKLNYILSDGKLNGCMYPDGKILWSGEIDKASFAPKHGHKQTTKTCFLCKVRILSDSKSLYKLEFIIHREDPVLISTFANRLQDLLLLYEKESTAMNKLNKWTLHV
ncbi:hypothetical protein HPULCUR_010125 [Helicostylum pulchrum]|uniref:Uncharacterized protein n=1 Tax=Helicostylum pulchrum TaxID=562976 RepID=A0ABP9YDF0_9FUNG